jgi:hypothetical protein
VKINALLIMINIVGSDPMEMMQLPLVYYMSMLFKLPRQINVPLILPFYIVPII